MSLNVGASTGNRAGLLRVLLLALSLMLAACSSDADNALADGDSPAPSPPLYEIATSDGAVTGWLFGTIHALPADTRWRTSTIDTVIAEADLLLVEVADLDNREQLARIFRELDDTPRLPPLTDRIPESLHPRLDSLISKGRLDLRSLSRSETWAAALVLARVETESDPANGVDRALIRAFSGRDIEEFEGAAAQLRIFDQLSEQSQRTLLVEVIKASHEQDEQARSLRKAWLAGDLEALEEASQSGILTVPALRAALLTERNQRWMARLESELQGTRRPLVAVGAAHLIGPEGLIELLEQSGYVVKQLR